MRDKKARLSSGLFFRLALAAGCSAIISMALHSKKKEQHQ
jgi:hypothetical protein